MRAKNLLILVVLAAIVVLIAFVGSKKKEEAPPDVVGMAVLPKLDVNSVDKIAIRSGVGSLTLARINDVWCIPEKFGYPASFTKIRSTLRKLADMKIGQVVDVSEAGKTDLKMRMPSISTNGPVSGSGTSVELLGKGDAKVGALLVGDSHRRKQEGAPADYRGYPDGQYVSTDGGKSVYLVKESLEDVSADGKSWLDSEIVNIPGADVAGITVALTNGESLKLSRPKGGGLVVEGLKESEETDASKMYGIEGALSYLRFDDVADPSLSAAQLGMDKPAIFTAVTTNGEIYTVKIGATAPNGDGRYVTIAATMTPETNDAAMAPQPEVKKDEKAVAQAAADKAAHRKEIEKKVTTVQEKVGKWTYVVAAYKANAMLSARSAFIKKKEVLNAGDAGKKEQVKPTGSESKKEAPKADGAKEQGGADKKKKGGGAFGWLKKLF